MTRALLPPLDYEPWESAKETLHLWCQILGKTAADRRAAVLDFLQSTFEAGGSLAGWDLDTTRTDWCPVPTGGSRG